MFECKNFRIIKCRSSRNYLDQYFENSFEKNMIKVYEKFEELSQKFKKIFVNFLENF